VAQGVGPEIKPQYHKTNKQTNKKTFQIADLTFEVLISIHPSVKKQFLEDIS
jgi:hypothetical protein